MLCSLTEEDEELSEVGEEQKEIGVENNFKEAE